MQKRLYKSSLPDAAKAEGAAVIDALARRALDPAKLSQFVQAVRVASERID